MQIIHYLKHYKINNLFADYYEQTKEGIIKYVLKVDGKTIYEGEKQLNETEIILLACSPL